MAAMWQQVLAIDAEFNRYRVPNCPHFRTVYMRRRSQLLRESAKNEAFNRNPLVRKSYLQMRTKLLNDRYGSPGFSDAGSIKSKFFSMRSIGRDIIENIECQDDFYKHHRRHMSCGSLIRQSEGTTKHMYDSIELVPTNTAEASRAMNVGVRSLSENYAFCGMQHIFDQHSASVTSVKFANGDNARIACASADSTLSICQVMPSPATVICMLRGHTAAVTDFVWSISNDVILSVSVDGSARLWAVASGTCMRVIDDEMGAHLLCCLFQPLNNNMFITGNSKFYVQVVNMSTGMGYKGGSSKVAGKVLTMAFNSSGHILWAGDDHGSISSFHFDIATGKLSRTHRLTFCEGKPITSISAWISQEGRDPCLLVNCCLNLLCLFRIVSSDGALRLRRVFPVKQKSAIIKSSFCPLMSFRHRACIVSGSEDSCIYIFDVTKENKPCVNKLLGHSGPVLDVCFNCDESLLASCDAQGLVIIWKREGYQCTKMR